MSVLVEKRQRWEFFETLFHAQCLKDGYANEFDALKDDANWSAALLTAWSLQNYCLHDFYLTRDGPHGVLGGRGL